jgi:hypothetical protein
MKTKPKDPTAMYAKQIALMIQVGTLPTLEQVQAALASTREEFRPQILAARGEQGQ